MIGISASSLPANLIIADTVDGNIYAMTEISREDEVEIKTD